MWYFTRYISLSVSSPVLVLGVGWLHGWCWVLDGYMGTL